MHPALRSRYCFPLSEQTIEQISPALCFRSNVSKEDRLRQQSHLLGKVLLLGSGKLSSYRCHEIVCRRVVGSTSVEIEY